MPFDAAYIRDPYATMARLRDNGAIHQVTTPDGNLLWLVTRYQEARDALADPRLSLDKRHSAGGYTGFGLPAAVICDLLGVPPEARRDFRRWTDVLVAPEAGADPRKAMAEMLTYLLGLIGDKRAYPGDDLISALIKAHDGADRLDENELISLIFLLLWAGYETTVDLIGNGLLLILTDPGLRDGLLTGRYPMPEVIEEVLRLDAPAILGIRRFATEDLELGGVTIPAGDTVMISLAAANHDPARFEAPETFMSGRRDRGHLTFGYGIHHCLGAPLARLEGRIAIDSALRRYPAMQLADPSADLAWRPSIRSHGLRSLPVLVKP